MFEVIMWVLGILALVLIGAFVVLRFGYRKSKKIVKKRYDNYQTRKTK